MTTKADQFFNNINVRRAQAVKRYESQYLTEILKEINSLDPSVVARTDERFGKNLVSISFFSFDSDAKCYALKHIAKKGPIEGFSTFYYDAFSFPFKKCFFRISERIPEPNKL